MGEPGDHRGRRSTARRRRTAIRTRRASPTRSRPTRSRASKPVPRSCTTTPTSSACPSQRGCRAVSRRVGDRCSPTRDGRFLYPTTNFGPGVEGAYSHMAPLAATGWLRIGIIDPGSVNLGGIDADGLPAAPGFVYANSFGDIRHQAAVCAGLRLGPSMAIFEPGWLRTALAWHRAGRLPKGAWSSSTRWRLRPTSHDCGPHARGAFGLPSDGRGASDRVLRTSGRGAKPLRRSRSSAAILIASP